MLPPILATKLFAPVARQRLVVRQRLFDRLDAGLTGRLTVVSAPAGSGKSVLLADWLRRRNQSAVWISLDAELSDPSLFLSYLIQGLQAIEPGVGLGLLEGLSSQFPPQPLAAIDALINELSVAEQRLVIVLDDFHRLEGSLVSLLVARLVEHLPPRLHLVLATREDPDLPLPLLRARGELNELRMDDLRFRPEEAHEFFRSSMNLPLKGDLVALLGAKTEGWAAGLQLAGLSLVNQPDPDAFVHTFAGSHRFVLDYLLDEVVRTLPPELHDFLLATSVLDRFCSELCDAVTGRTDSAVQLARLEQANLFLVSLDVSRSWFRYHHLFAEMLIQRRSAVGDDQSLHLRASEWFASHGFGADAFRHAVAAGASERAALLVETDKIPSLDRAAVAGVLRWLESLPHEFLHQRPVLSLRWATLLLFAGQTAGVDERASWAESQWAAHEAPDRDLLGQAAAARATVAVTRYQAEAIVEHAHRALDHLNAANLPYRFTAQAALGFGQLLQGDRQAALASYRAALTLADRSGDRFSRAMALTSLGQMRELNADPVGAGEAYTTVLELMGTHPQPYACEASLGLARVRYWANDLDAAERLGRASLDLARQYDPSIDRFVLAELLLARCSLARGDHSAAGDQLSRTSRAIRDQGFDHRWADWSAVEIDRLLALGKTKDAEQVAAAHPSPWTSLRLGLAQARPEVLTEARALTAQMRRRGWVEEELRAKLLEAMALHQAGLHDEAQSRLAECQRSAGPNYPRLFLDEGPLLRSLLDAESGTTKGEESLSARELEVLTLVAQGLSNEAIGKRLFVALDTIKGHNRRIFEKLKVSRRTEAVAVARRLGLLPS